MAYSPALNRQQAARQYVTTTDATVTTIKTIPVRIGSVVRLWIEACAVRTGGSSGTSGDSAGYILTATVKNVSGTAALVGSVTVVSASEDQVAWDCTVSVTSGTAIVTVAGAANNNVSWSAMVDVINNI